jgi:exodeoxyribonuclease VII small subunit
MTVMSEKKSATYEDDLEELTRLVDNIGDQDCPMDELETKVRRAADLIKSLRQRLSSTESTVQEVLTDLENSHVEKQ